MTTQPAKHILIKIPRYGLGTVPVWYQYRMGWYDTMGIGTAFVNVARAFTKVAFAADEAAQAFVTTFKVVLNDDATTR